jgi:pimeloyl-ACP methyl ester carboxylesterase
MTDFLLDGVTDVHAHFISVGGNKIHYVTIGRGEHTLVFVHGWACHLGFWREQIAALADKARLVLIDLPGHGQSDKPDTNYTMDFFAEAVLAVMRDAGVEKAALIGHSMGGAVICRVHHYAPEKVAALVSVDGLLCRLPGTAAEGRALVGPFTTPHYREHAVEFIRSLFPFPGAEKLCEQVTSEMLKTPRHVMLGGMLAMLDPDQPDWILQKVNAPVIVINARSPWWTAGYENYVRALSPQTDYETMEGASHFLMLEKPDEFNARLLEKLRHFDLIQSSAPAKENMNRA